MDKIRLSDMGIFPKVMPISMKIGEADVEINPYISYADVLEMIQWCIDYIINGRPFLSAPLVQIVKDFAMLKWYTNFDFTFLDTCTDLKEIYEEYDFVQRFNLIEQVRPKIDPRQLVFFEDTLAKTLDSIIAYRNSAAGIVDALAENAKQDTADMQAAIEMINKDGNAEKMAALMQLAQSIAGPTLGENKDDDSSEEKKEETSE